MQRMDTPQTVTPTKAPAVLKNYSKLKLISSAFVDGFVWTADAKSVFD